MRKKKRFPKSKAQRLHALRRGKERYQETFSEKELKEISNMIKGGRSRFIKKLSNSRTKHVVAYGSKDYCVVYDKTRQQICSFLPWSEDV